MHPPSFLPPPIPNPPLLPLFSPAPCPKVAADSFLLYLAPRRSDYRLFVESTSPDFSPDTEAERQVLEQILKKKRQKQALAYAKDMTHVPAPDDDAAARQMPLAAPLLQPSAAPASFPSAA